MTAETESNTRTYAQTHTCVRHLSKSITECNRHGMPAARIKGALLKPLTLHTYSLTYMLMCDTCTSKQTHTHAGTLTLRSHKLRCKIKSQFTLEKREEITLYMLDSQRK